MTGIGAGETAAETRGLPRPAGGDLPCALGRCRDGSPCRRLAAFTARPGLPAKEENTHG